MRDLSCRDRRCEVWGEKGDMGDAIVVVSCGGLLPRRGQWKVMV